MPEPVRVRATRVDFRTRGREVMPLASLVNSGKWSAAEEAAMLSGGKANVPITPDVAYTGKG